MGSDISLALECILSELKKSFMNFFLLIYRFALINMRIINQIASSGHYYVLIMRHPSRLSLVNKDLKVKNIINTIIL
jgi:hypothetical protein